MCIIIYNNIYMYIQTGSRQSVQGEYIANVCIRVIDTCEEGHWIRSVMYITPPLSLL